MIALTATTAMLTYRFVMNAYILIGGRSSRMGVSKTELFLDRILAAALPVFDEVVAVQRSGGEAVAIRTIFEEPHEQDGAVFGVARALRDVQERGLTHGFVLAVDYPMITADVLRHLRDRGGVPIWDGRPQMLCAVWDVRALPRIEERIGERRARFARSRRSGDDPRGRVARPLRRRAAAQRQYARGVGGSEVEWLTRISRISTRPAASPW
jgi:molybdopterin-guanine dinucleotide biosynthesis protein A